MKERWLEFVENCKDAVREIAPVFGFLALLFAGIFLVAFIADKSEEEKNKPTPKPTETVAAVTMATPEPTPTPTPEPTLSPEELNKLIAREEALWRQEALEYAKENLPPNYKELVYEYYSLLEDYEELDSLVFDLEEEVEDLKDDLRDERGY